MFGGFALIMLSGLLWVMITNTNPRVVSEKVPPIPTAVDGQLDLSDWDFAWSQSVPLEGEWHFYWGELLTAEEINSRAAEPKDIIYAPRPWVRDQPKEYPIHGIGTYHLQIIIPSNSSMLAIKTAGLDTVFELNADGQRLAYAGSFGPDKNQYIHGFGQRWGQFQPKSEVVDIVIHVGNYDFRNAGITQNIQFGEATNIIQLREVELILEFFLVGSMLIMGLYHFGLYVTRRRENGSAFTFGFFCLLMAIRILVTGSHYLMEAAPILSWGLITRANFLTFYIGAPVFHHFVHQLYPD
ncbi:MAG: 7TM diverse intracellular signaling domain-containing protein, partial [Chloroflexota bacterium]